jgi:hypothetical protein
VLRRLSVFVAALALALASGAGVVGDEGGSGSVAWSAAACDAALVASPRSQPHVFRVDGRNAPSNAGVALGPSAPTILVPSATRLASAHEARRPVPGASPSAPRTSRGPPPATIESV